MSSEREMDIIRFAEEVLEIDILPWQADLLRAAARKDYRGLTLSHPSRRDKARGIEQVHAVLDEWRDQLIDQTVWLSPEVTLADVYRVAAKHLPDTTMKGTKL